MTAVLRLASACSKVLNAYQSDSKCNTFMHQYQYPCAVDPILHPALSTIVGQGPSKASPPCVYKFDRCILGTALAHLPSHIRFTCPASFLIFELARRCRAILKPLALVPEARRRVLSVLERLLGTLWLVKRYPVLILRSTRWCSQKN
jgi:hypothetical protein